MNDPTSLDTEAAANRTEGTPYDQWSEWLLHGRFSGNRESHSKALSALLPVRDTVLDNAELSPGDTVLDIGCGDGLIGFGVFNLLSECDVIFLDISNNLLDACRDIAAAAGLTEKCRFVNSNIHSMDIIDNESIDVVTGRSVLCYSSNLQAAVAETYRVLRKGGRLSLFEPVNSFTRLYGKPNSIYGYDLSHIPDIAKKILMAFDQEQGSGIDSMIAFDEDNLFQVARAAGFSEVYIEKKGYATPSCQFSDLETMLNFAPNPFTPSLQEVSHSTLNVKERIIFMKHLQSLIDSGAGETVGAYCYAVAVK